MTEVLFTIAFTWNLLLLLAAVLGYTLIILLALWWFAAKRPETAFSRFWREQVWPVRRLLEVVGAVWIALFLLAVIKGFILLLPQAVSPPPFLAFFADRSGAANLGAGALIVAMLGSPLVIWATILKHRTVSFQKEGHMTDRISKAVEQLGAEKTVKLEGKEQTQSNIEVRVGGLLSLERIANDSMKFDNGRDHVLVMRIICAYLRQNSPANDLTLPTAGATLLASPKLDIRQAAEILKRRSVRQLEQEEKEKYRLDLRRVNLDDVDMSNGNFSGAMFDESRLHYTDMRKTDLTGARFVGATIAEAIFAGSTLKGVKFQKARLSDRVADDGLGLTYARVESLEVFGADLRGLSRFLASADNGNIKTALIGDAATTLPFLFVPTAEDRRTDAKTPKPNIGPSIPTAAPNEQRSRYLTIFQGPLRTPEFYGFIRKWRETQGNTGWPFED